MARSVEAEIFDQIFRDLRDRGRSACPRGLQVLELENYSYELPPFVRFQNFASRKLNLGYIKAEFLWYLRGDKFDHSIAEKAKIWREIVNEDGSFNSNYGAYLFTGGQFDNVIKVLSEDADSRRASAVILTAEHLSSDTKDVPCTYAMNFRIRDNKLNMSVHMRSQDAIFGMGNDVPMFSFTQEMVLNSLLPTYSHLEMGSYFHTVDSLHVYERHFKTLDALADGDEFAQISCPRISGPDEVRHLRALDFSCGEFSRWLTNESHSS